METFTERFNRLTKSIEDVDLMKATGLSLGAVADLRTGRTKSMKLSQALKLCRKLRITPWALQGEPEPRAHSGVAFEDLPEEAPDEVVRLYEMMAEVRNQLEEMQKEYRTGIAEVARLVAHAPIQPALESPTKPATAPRKKARRS